MGTRLEQERCFPPPVPDLHSLLEQGNVFFVGHVTPLTAGMGFILAGAKTPINVRLGSCPIVQPPPRSMVCCAPCYDRVSHVTRSATHRPSSRRHHGRRALANSARIWSSST